GPLQAAARARNVSVVVHELAPGAAADATLDAIRRDRPDGLVVLPDAYLRTFESRILDLATRMRVPAIYGNRQYVDAGGLMAYGPDFRENFRRAATYVDRILKGASPRDLPVERPTRFELVLNAKTARSLGLTIPQSLLLQSDRIIE
ncbi:MAG TPA: ABC transporter substrate-binding protein, partial [Terriglobales bacterium]|nr:ABC transporter substrate-binding protein [Terriglobales bacterium]